MARAPRSPVDRARSEAGFTLMEVIIAMVLLSLVSVAVLGLFVRAMKDSTGLDRRQAAVGVASQAMELARSIPALQDANGNSTLTSGRTQAVVNAQWAAATGADLSQTDQTWDTTASATSVPALPLTSTTTVAGVTYTATNLVGTCWRPPAGGTCVQAASKAASAVELYRVVVLVTWSEGAGTTCSAAACSYSLASLVDPATDPKFNINATNATWPAPPVLTAISATTAMNTPVTVDLSTAVTSGATPMTASTGTVTQGATASVLPNTTQVTVTPATGYWSGTNVSVPFTLTDPYGQSTSTTLTVHVTPPAGPTAANGTATASKNGHVTITLSGFVTGGTGTLTYSTTSTPAHGGLSAVSGAQVTYTPTHGWTGSDSFTYQVADTYGHTATATITVTVS